MYPEEAKKIDQGFGEAGPVIWKAFTRATGLAKFFAFTPEPMTNKTNTEEIDKPSNLL